jgi:hypothetical protein
MFVLTANVHRSGAVCREYYQPDEKEAPGGVVFGMLDGKKRAKHYLTEDEAAADIPAFKAVVGQEALAVDVVPL